MLRFGTEQEQGDPGDPSESPSLPDVENAVPDDVQDSALQNIESLGPIFGAILNMVIGVVSGIVLTAIVALAVRIALRTRSRMLSHMKILLVPGFTAMGFLGARVGLELSGRDLSLYELLAFLLLIGTAAGFAWFALRVVSVIQRRVELRYDEVTTEDRRGRRIKTQMQLIKRVLNTIIIIIAVSAILLSIPQVRALGAGLLASAGLVSVVAALAVQTTLTNVFAGMQLAFTDAIRVGDVVVMDEYYGTIEDITMSYVVLKIWDGRRIIYPSSYFTTTPFENYTRVGTEISAGIDFQVDWRVPMDALRARLRALVESSDLWDGRDVSIQVLDIANERATLRVAVSARNAGELWDLQCLVREDFIKFISEEHPQALSVMRVENLPPAPAEAAMFHEQSHNGQQTDPGSARGGTPWNMTSVPEVDSEKVRSRRSQEPPVERGWIPTVQRKTEDGLVETGPDTSSVPLTQPSEDGSMYTGSIAAIERGADMAGPGEDAYQARAQRTDEDDEDTDQSQEPDHTQQFEQVTEDKSEASAQRSK
ncbi:MAG TPA: mechanosensitive ion channel family protein [Candidatus Yaniella excrementigallinarum]|nr:mechanosensitive ion channel family protein [Candidatus Yaniella excrementigallinarum]